MDDQIDGLAELTPEQIAEAKKIFEGKVEGKSGCWHCGGIHDRVFGLPPARQPCPRVKHIKWHLDGSVIEVEYWPRGDWEPSSDQVIYPHDVYGYEDSDEDII